MAGVAEGVGLSLASLQSTGSGCFNNTGKLYEEATELVKKMETDNKVTQMSNLYSLYTLTISELKLCGSIPSEMTQLAFSFSNPTTLAMHLSKDMVVNGVDIYKKMEEGKAAFKNQEYKRFG